MSEETVTIQKTSKKLKLHLILCWLGFIIGIFWVIGAHENAKITNEPMGYGSIILIVASIIWYIITKFRIWWNHG